MYKMKRKHLLVILLALFLGSWAQAHEAINVYASSSGTSFKIGESAEREVCGGTKINVTYKGSGFFPYAKGAFEYACKLVEDAIPTTYPINIVVEFTNNISDNNCLAMVTNRDGAVS